jgi:hypothetical protein
LSRSRAAAAAAPLLFLLVLSLPGKAQGYEFRLVPSAAVKEERNDNIFFSSSENEDSYITTVSPGLALVDRTERLDLSLSTALHWITYSGLSELDATDHESRGKFAFRATPRIRLSGEAAFRRDTRPDRFLETTGLPVTNRSNRQDYSGEAGLTVTDHTEVDLGYAYEKLDYKDLTDLDSESHTGSLTLVHDLERYFRLTKGRAGFGYARSRFPGLVVENWTATIGFLRGVTELWSVLVDAGGRYTRSEFDVLRPEVVPPFFIVFVPGTEKKDGWGWVANVSMMYRGEKNRGSLTFSRDVSAAIGRAGASERTAAVLEVSRRFMYEFSGSLTAGYYRNRSDAQEFSTAKIDEETVRVRPSLRYAFTRNVSLEAAYQYTRIEYRESKSRADQNVAFLRFAVQLPLFE